jgi:hypothetical protein
MKIKVLIVALLISSALAGQKPYADIVNTRNKINSGIGIAFTGSDAMWGYSMHTTWHYFLNENISLAPGLAVMHFRDDSENVLRTAQAEMLDIGVYIHLMPRRPLSFEFGGGGNLRYFHWAVATTLAESYTFDGQLVRAGSKEVFDHFTGGYFVSAGFGYQISPSFELFFNEMLQNDGLNNVTWDSRLGLRIQF